MQSRTNLKLENHIHSMFIITSLSIHLFFVAVSLEISFAHGHISGNLILNRSTLPIDGTQIGTITPGQSEIKSSIKDGVLHTPRFSRTGASISNTI